MESKTSDALNLESHVSSGDLVAESVKDPSTCDNMSKFFTPNEKLSDSMSEFFTPNEKLSGYKAGQQVATVDIHYSSGGDRSDLSPKDGSGSSSPLSCNSDSADFYSIQRRLSPYSDCDGKNFQRKIMDQETEVPVINEKIQFIKEENETYEKLLDRISKYEDEQRVLKKKLKFSEEEVYHLQCELKKSESLTGSFQAKLDSTLDDIGKKTDDLNLEKRRASQLQTQLTKLEVEVSEFNVMIQILEKEKDFYLRNWNVSGEEVNKLKDELDRKGADESLYLLGQLELAQQEILKLDTELKFISERHVTDTSARNQEVVELVKTLQDEVREREYENMNMQRLYDDREMSLQDEIHSLKVENAKKCDLVERLNEELDLLQLKRDTVIAENDNLKAELQTVMAQRSSQNNAMRHVEEQVGQLTMHRFELINESNSSRKLVDELTLKVQALEKEVGGQRVLISEAAEEKKEAIRQLCLALEHYRGWYHELRLAFAGPRRPPAVTA